MNNHDTSSYNDHFNSNPYAYPSDDHQPEGPSKPNPKINDLQQQVDDTMGIMKENIGKVLERGENLENMHGKTDKMNQGAMQFRSGATKVRNKMWWQNMRRNIIIAVVVIILIVVIVVPIVVSKK